MCSHKILTLLTINIQSRNMYLLDNYIYLLLNVEDICSFQLFLLLLNVFALKFFILSLSLFLSHSLPHQARNNDHMTFGTICQFLFLALVVHPKASARPNYVTFVLLVRHTFFLLLSVGLSFPSGCEKCLARAVQLHTGRGYAPAHWLKWKNNAFGLAAVGREWSSHCWKHTK